ncbi:LPS biosynthesis protein [Allgaiera indica]|uniref:LPS biosynthesis protein n=1 Tax=Allgaiera indica TaxID=765699 RepID=A0AAN4ZXU8_9RHOB|nr:GNVR domain-containing protein [Allgaiera indica]GHD98553.1 LPS biosynthesis protein [Allgaiera indica]SDW11126.1 polysaccharide chain length determinant protein, PEP-CTERM locus subfamily [Allgaiera indica]
MTIDLKYYFAIFRRRFHYFALAFVAVLAVAGTAALKLPPTYTSQARLLLESPQIPNSLAAPTVSTAALEQLQIFEQRLMTRQNLLEIARRFQVFPGIDTMSPDRIVDAMRDSTQIRNSTGRDQATTMTIAFSARSAATAAAVVNEYVTRILNFSASMRTNQAEQTLQFFKQEVERLSTSLNAQSAKILSFQNQHRGALPATLDFRMTEQSSLRERLNSVQRQVADLRDQKQRLVAIFNATGGVSTNSTGASVSPEAQHLTALQAQLAQALAVLSKSNPKVLMLKAQIAQLEKTVTHQQAAAAAGAATTAADASNNVSTAQKAMLDIQTAQIDGRITQLENQEQELVKTLAKLGKSIDETADNKIALDALERDYDNIQSQYNAAVTRLSQASTGERIEALSKGQRLAVLDPATAPDQPSRPDRRKIILLGLIAGVALGLGLIVLREMLDTSLRRPADLTNALGVTPLVAIPYVRTPGETVGRRMITLGALMLVAVVVPLSMWAIDTYYMPLDLLAAKIQTKLGG